MTDKNYHELHMAAAELIMARYAPKKHVIAAAVRGASGEIYTAVNLDCHLRRAAVCAEGAAIALAMSAGEEKIKAVLALRYDPEVGQPWIVSPCGICRELILDYGDHAVVYVPDQKQPHAETAEALLPNRYAKVRN
jgi:cytidine deaminase